MHYNLKYKIRPSYGKISEALARAVCSHLPMETSTPTLKSEEHQDNQPHIYLNS